MFSVVDITAGFLSSIFKLLPKDPVETVHFVLSTLMQRVSPCAEVSCRHDDEFPWP